MQTGLRALQGSIPGTAMGTSPRKAGLGAVPEMLPHAGIAKLQTLQGLLRSLRDTVWDGEKPWIQGEPRGFLSCGTGEADSR